MTEQDFRLCIEQSKKEDHILVSRYEAKDKELVTYIIESEGLITAFLEGENYYNMELVALLNKDAYEKIKEFSISLASDIDASPNYTLEIKSKGNTDYYHLNNQSFTRFIVTMQDAINAGISLLNMTEEEKIETLRKLKNKISENK